MNIFEQTYFLDILIILVGTVIAIIITRTLIFNSLMKFASASESKYDDEVIKALKKPLTLIPLGIGLYASVLSLPLSSTYANYADLLIKSYFYIAIFWSVASAADPLRDFIGDKYNFLSPTLRAWIFRAFKFVAYLIGIVSVLELWGVDAASIIAGLGPVSYTHLTLPTIYSV